MREGRPEAASCTRWRRCTPHVEQARTTYELDVHPAALHLLNVDRLLALAALGLLAGGVLLLDALDLPTSVARITRTEHDAAEAEYALGCRFAGGQPRRVVPESGETTIARPGGE